MKLRIIGLALLIVCVLVFISCTNDSAGFSNEENGTLHISVVMNGVSKSTLAQTREEDNNVETLDVFVFRDTENEDNGILDTYKKFQGEELENMSDLAVSTTTGEKRIYAIANSHIVDYSSITSLQSFKELEGDLRKEKFSFFTMTGETKALLGINTSINIVLERLVSCIEISNIKTAFEGTPYQGQTLSNVKLYLINVQGNKLIHSGASCIKPIILNSAGINETDIALFSQRDLIYDEISSEISDKGYNQTHYLYCYENSIASESATTHFTRAVIQGDLCGKRYYYPINVNQTGSGYSEVNGHYGIKRNTVYSISVTIYRPGSTDPNVTVAHGSASCSITIQDWNTNNTSNIIF